MRAVVESVKKQLGMTFVVIFPRQSGKNELQAHLEAFLLVMFSSREGEIVKVSPTWKPQAQNAMRRLERVLKRNLYTSLVWQKEQGYIYRLQNARISFLSGAESSNVVGATASILLSCDEAQDVSLDKWDKEINPMAASTNATRVFFGTAWTPGTLLGREMRLAREAEKSDGMQRVFLLNADQVRQEAPAYGAFVDSEVKRLGRSHPFIRSQYFSEEIEAQGGLFTPSRLALMEGSQPSLAAPQPGKTYAFTLDVGGESSAGERISPTDEHDHDATALTICEVELPSPQEALLQGPRFLVRWRKAWSGASHSRLVAEINALAELWQPRYVVADATGVGAGLASFLGKMLGAGRLLPFTFSQSSKSELGWAFLGLTETGRFKSCRPPEAEGEQCELNRLFFAQCAACGSELLPGVGRLLRWGVPESARDPLTGRPLHDDLLVSAALCAALDKQPWGSAESAVIRPIDPLANLNF